MRQRSWEKCFCLWVNMEFWHRSCQKCDWRPELGSRQFCRYNVSMLSGPKVVCNCHFTIFIVAIPSRHRGLTIFRFFAGPWLFPEAILRCRVVALSRCRCREAKKLSRAQLCWRQCFGFCLILSQQFWHVPGSGKATISFLPTLLGFIYYFNNNKKLLVFEKNAINKSDSKYKFVKTILLTGTQR